MKYIILTTLLFLNIINTSATSPAVLALNDEQFSDYVEFSDDGMVIEFADICANLVNCKWGLNLTYNDLLDIKIKLIAATNDSDDHIKVKGDYLRLCDQSNCAGNYITKSVRIISSLPIVHFSSGQEDFSLSRGTYIDMNGRGRTSVDIDNKKMISIEADTLITLKSITVSGGLAGFKGYYDMAKLPLKNSLKMIKRETITFQKHMSKSDRNLDHFERFIVSLDDAVSIIEDPKSYSVLDWRVQEGMRRVVSFGMIISDLLWAYEDVPSIQKNIENIRKFRNEVRTTYGWDNTLAGNVSKTTGAIFELLHYELKQIVLLKMEAGFDNYEIYGDLTDEIRSLIAMVNANDGGDMVVAQNIGSFMNAWNDSVWQNELQSLMEAKLDVRKLVRPKLKYILNAVMALEELIDQRKVYFDIDVISEAADTKTLN